MIRGLFGISCLMAAGGCVALNSGFEESGVGTEGTGSSDTERNTASESDSDPSGGRGSSAVTTVTAGDASTGGSPDPTDSAGDSDTGSRGSSSGTSGGGSSSDGGELDSGSVDCPVMGGPVSQDAFLFNCADGECGALNYGQTDAFPLSGGNPLSVFLLRVPEPVGEAESVDVTLTMVAEEGAANGGFQVSAFAIDPPCNWSEGLGDEDLLEAGQSGVTHDLCEANPLMSTPWGPVGDADVWDNVDGEWGSDSVSVGPKKFSPGDVFTITLSLMRNIAGTAPHSILIASDTMNSGGLFVFSSETVGSEPIVDVHPTCP